MSELSTGRKATKFIEFIIVRSLIFWMEIIPFRLRAFLGEKFGLFLHKVAGRYRKLVNTNLRHAFPEKAKEWLDKTTRDNFIYMGRLIAEVVALPKSVQDKFVDQWVVFKPNKQSLVDYFQEGGLGITGHLAVWEWMPALVGYLRGNVVYSFAKRQSNPWSNRYIEKSRLKTGYQILYSDMNPKKVFKFLRQKEVVGFCSDQYAGPSGKPFPFFNRPTSAFMGPSYFARLNKVPLCFLSIHHDEQKRIVFEVETIPEPKVDRRQDPETWDKIFTYTWLKMLEKRIRKNPSDYFWVHDRWKNQPENAQEILDSFEGFAEQHDIAIN